MRQALAEERPERLGAATASGANEGLALRDAELDGIEVRAIGWQVPEGGPGGLDGALDAGDLVGPEIVGNDDVAGLQGRRRRVPRDPRGREKRAGLPAPAGGVVVDARAIVFGRSQVGAAACHATRAAATSGRSCSDGRTVFFNGQAEGPHGAPDRRHTRGRGEGVLQLSQRAIRLRRNQRGQGV